LELRHTQAWCPIDYRQRWVKLSNGTAVAGRVTHRRRMAQTHYLELSELTQLPPSYIAWQKQQTGASSLSCMLARGESVGGDGLQSQC
jgi:hypothetical protein